MIRMRNPAKSPWKPKKLRPKKPEPSFRNDNRKAAPHRAAFLLAPGCRQMGREAVRRTWEGSTPTQSAEQPLDRKSVAEGKSVSVRVELGGRRIRKKKKYNKPTT